eukprot:TRINITY_DN28493_c0_g1_i1.p1 TRINITY_DN28493_c0_g1~~TRINITY_DN28493_c0_g1_i1.p1  ORF type:complete len:415 (+),score=61.21 TRINITY_DN28493_c0_g1_i1:78-1322(+)
MAEPQPDPNAGQAFDIRDITQARQPLNPGGGRPAQSRPPAAARPASNSGGNVERFEVNVPAQQPLRERFPQVVQAEGFVRQHPSAILGCGCISLIALLIVVLVSLGSLDPTEYGLRYNRISKTVDKSYVYRGGRHLIGPFASFLVFPATVKSLEFSNRSQAQAPPLGTRTAEGLALNLHVAFQYHLIRDQVPQLYQSTNIMYESLYMKIARDIILRAAAQYNAPQYWTERRAIGESMLSEVNAALKASHAECTGLQLLVIELPSQYESSIVATQVQKQDIKSKENEQKAAIIRAQIKVMIADYQKNITVTLASANANASYATKAAAARATKMKIDAESQAFDSVSSQLNLSTSGLVDYQRNFAYQSMDNASFLSGVPNAVVVQNAAGVDSSVCRSSGQGPSDVANAATTALKGF